MILGLPHPALLPYLPTRILKAVHLLASNLRGRHWGSNRPALSFVSRHSWQHLIAYHHRVIWELRCRGFHPSPKWADPCYRGRTAAPWPHEDQGQPQQAPDTLGYPCHTSHDYRASLAHLRKRLAGGKWTEEDRIRMSLAPEVVE